jgi:hypothetical protein
VLKPTHGAVKRRPHAGHRVHVCAVLQEQLDHPDITMFRPAMQRHQPLLVAVNGVHVRAKFNEQTGCIKVAARGVERRGIAMLATSIGQSRRGVQQSSQLVYIPKFRCFEDVKRRTKSPQHRDRRALSTLDGKEERPVELPSAASFDQRGFVGQ